MWSVGSDVSKACVDWVGVDFIVSLAGCASHILAITLYRWYAAMISLSLNNCIVMTSSREVDSN